MLMNGPGVYSGVSLGGGESLKVVEALNPMKTIDFTNLGGGGGGAEPP